MGMLLPLSTAAVDRLDWVAEIGSTNAELAARASRAEEPDFSVLATSSQTAGRGRLGRQWVAPPGKTLAVSVLLRPGGDVASFGWLPLLAGLAMTRAVSSLVSGHAVGLKWPNDVLVDGLKVSGLLAELVPAGDAVVMGAGLNLSFEHHELPTDTATSLTLMGVEPVGIVDRALSAYLVALRELYDEFPADPGHTGLRTAVTAACTTIGRPVRVELPGGEVLHATATGIDASDRLVVTGESGAVQSVAAGDVTHLRYE